MAFTSTLVQKEQLPGGFVLERYKWNGDSVTTGSITANTTVQPEIQKIGPCGASSDGDSAALTYALDTGANILKLTFASGDTGEAWIIGKAA